MMRADDENGIDAAGDATAEPRPESSPSHNEDMREALNHLVRHQTDREGGEALSLRRRVFEQTLEDSGYSQEMKDALREMERSNPAAFNPAGQITVNYISTWVERACRGLGLELHRGVVAGLMPSTTANASSSDFFGTGIAIVGLDAGVLTLTAALSRLLARTIQWTPLGTYPGFEYAADAAIERAIDHIELRTDWFHFFARFAGIPLPFEFAQAVLEPELRARAFDLMAALEVYVVAHEYGHHIHQHQVGEAGSDGLDVKTAHQREYEADRTAIAISTYLGTMGYNGDSLGKLPNLWMESGGAAVAYLTAADCARCLNEILMTGDWSEPLSPTHPPFKPRLLAMEEVLRPRRNLIFRAFAVELIRGIFNYFMPAFAKMHKDGLRPVLPGFPGAEDPR